MKRNKLAIAVVGGVASLSLLGLGAGASFTDTASASQHVSTGTINLQLSTDGGATFSKSVAFTPDSNLTSAGESVSKTLTYFNQGSLPVKISSVHLDLGGPIVIGVQTGGLTLHAGDNPITPTFVLNPGVSASVPVTITVPADEPQGATGDALITVNATD
jgi:hypothetical protein